MDLTKDQNAWEVLSKNISNRSLFSYPVPTIQLGYKFTSVLAGSCLKPTNTASRLVSYDTYHLKTYLKREDNEHD